MAIYAIGDIHGCDRSLKMLLKKIHFTPNSDELILVGDLINRGPKSVDVLQRILDYGDAVSSVSGNHDITLLAIHAGFVKQRKKDTYQNILQSKECHEFIEFIRHLPMLIEKQTEFKHIIITHAGLHPNWGLLDVRRYDQEIQNMLQDNSKNYFDFLSVLFSNQPDIWDESLQGFDRLRTLINCFTRMRFLDKNKKLDFDYKETIECAPSHLIPWFNFERPQQKNLNIIHGHWAALGLHESTNTLGIDSGCAWNGRLTAVRIDTPKYEFFSVNNHDH